MRFLTATRLVFFPLLAALASTLLVACSNGAGDEEPAMPTLDEANLTVDQVYARFAEAINRPGSIYRVTVLIEISAEQSWVEATTTTWIDAGRDLAREKIDSTVGTAHEASTSITANGWEYRHYEQPPQDELYTKVGAPLTCHGVNAAVSSGLRCPGRTAESTTTLDTGEYEGRHAVILVTSGTNHGSDETITFTDRFYLDASTMLPIASEGEGDTGEMHFTELHTYQNDFVPADSLPEDFFDPASIGYVEPTPRMPMEGTNPQGGTSAPLPRAPVAP